MVSELEHSAHLVADGARGFGLLLTADRDTLNQLRQLQCHALDLTQRAARFVGQARTVHHALRALFHRGDGVLGVGLNRVDDAADLASRFRGAFREPLHFFGDDAEALAGIACGGGLNGRVQRQHVGLLGNLGEQIDDLPDLLRALTQAFDALCRLLYLLTQPVHALDGVLHRRRALLGGRDRLARDLRGLRCVRRHLLNRARHERYRLSAVANLTGLLRASELEVATCSAAWLIRTTSWPSCSIV